LSVTLNKLISRETIGRKIDKGYSPSTMWKLISSAMFVKNSATMRKEKRAWSPPTVESKRPLEREKQKKIKLLFKPKETSQATSAQWASLRRKETRHAWHFKEGRREKKCWGKGVLEDEKKPRP